MTPIVLSAVKYGLVAAAAAAAMYWLDPELGRRRRESARDKLVSAVRRATGGGPREGVAPSRSLIRANDVSDAVLAERVRWALRRATSHLDEIEVSCSQGVVILRGVVLKHEHPRVMRAARSAASGSEVHDELAAYKRPSSSPHVASSTSEL